MKYLYSPSRNLNELVSGNTNNTTTFTVPDATNVLLSTNWNHLFELFNVDEEKILNEFKERIKAYSKALFCKKVINTHSYSYRNKQYAPKLASAYNFKEKEIRHR